MKNQLLIELLFLLLSRDKVTAKYIADRFGISLRTAYRYVDELSLCVPVYNTRGRNGGFAISETYKLPATFLTPEETEFLLNILYGVDTEVGSDTLKKIIDKILSISKKNYGDTSLDFGNLVIDGGAWGDTDSTRGTVAFLEKCIENKTVVTLGYRDREGVLSERDTEPHTLILKQGLWYLYAFCRKRGEFRLFKVGRMERLNARDETFIRKPTDNLKIALSEWYDSLKAETIELEVSKNARADVEEWLGVNKKFVMPDGKIRFSAEMPVDAALAGKILSFGSAVKVISPEKLKKSVISLAKEIADMYENEK